MMMNLKLGVKVFCWEILFLIVCVTCKGEIQKEDTTGILLADGHRPLMTIYEPAGTSPAGSFAASELQKYLFKISGGYFEVRKYKHGENTVNGIILRTDSTFGDDEYSISVNEGRIILGGGTSRAVLYAVYDFLEGLGCFWSAPDLPYYEGVFEHIPQCATLFYNGEGETRKKPAFKYRKLDIFGKGDDLPKLKAIIDWMPRVRLNTIQVLFGKDGEKWDHWRKDLIPEIEKRGIIIEAGGHGYQNFLNVETENGKILRNHPEWFGKDSNCILSGSKRVVFNIWNDDAIKYFINNVILYLKGHPEIKIFDFWPPDGALWDTCNRESQDMSPSDRQVYLANKLNTAIKKEISWDVKLEIIAYLDALMPPVKEEPDSDILVDFCPIEQSFEKQIFDPGSAGNRVYSNALLSWRRVFQGEIGLYSYYRKAAWRSLPNMIPHYMQKDMQWYSNIPLQGISCYAKQADWLTYELNHYIFGRLSWNPDLNVDSIIKLFSQNRFGPFSQDMIRVYEVLESVVPAAGSIPYSSLKSVAEIDFASKRISECMSLVQRTKKEKYDPVLKNALIRVQLILQFVLYDLDIQRMRADNRSYNSIKEKVEQLLKFRMKNNDKGIFQLSSANEDILLMKHYGLTNRSLLDL